MLPTPIEPSHNPESPFMDGCGIEVASSLFVLFLVTCDVVVSLVC